LHDEYAARDHPLYDPDHMEAQRAAFFVPAPAPDGRLAGTIAARKTKFDLGASCGLGERWQLQARTLRVYGFTPAPVIRGD
jgi:hypothetical protein